MRRREFITLFGGVAAAWPLVARAQQRSRLAHVVFFSPGTLEDFRAQGFQQGLRELGYVDGENIAIEYDFAAPEEFAQRASEIVARRPDAIVAATTPVSLAVMRATTTIPVVAASVADPVASGLADSLARPGRNITSLSLIATDLTGKRLEILKEVIPGLARLGVLMNPDDPAAMLQVAEARSAAAALGLDVRMLDARPSNDLGVIFEGIAKDEVQALAIPQASWFVNNRSRIARLAIEHRVPTIVGARIEVTAGALLGYGTDLRSIFRRSAYLLDKILKGTNPADIPVEQPTRFELVINLKTARALGLEIPATLLARADEVIE